MRSEEEFGTILMASLIPLGLALGVWGLTLPSPAAKLALAAAATPAPAPVAAPTPVILAPSQAATPTEVQVEKPARDVAAIVSVPPEPVNPDSLVNRPRTNCTLVPYQCRKWSEEWTLSSEASSVPTLTTREDSHLGPMAFEALTDGLFDNE